MSKAYKVVRDFEEEIAKWGGSKYAISTESCTSSIFLCLKYLQPKTIWIPRFTYPGVAMSVLNAGIELKFTKSNWKGIYRLVGSNIIDSALRFKKGMYIPDTFYCLSFHYKKLLPIGRGGMILTNDKKAMDWLKMARFDGRREIPLLKDNATILGWNMYLTPEQASRGLALFDSIRNKDIKDLVVSKQGYPDLSKWEVFK